MEKPGSVDEGTVMRDALEFIQRGSTKDSAWARTFVLADLRIPRVELLSFDGTIDEMYHMLATLVVDKWLSAFTVATWPVHDDEGETHAN